MDHEAREGPGSGYARRLEESISAIRAGLEGRLPGDLSFRLERPEGLPEVAEIVDLVNALGTDLQDRSRREEERSERRSKELSKAYEALQAKNDEIQRDLDAARRVQLQLLPQDYDLPRTGEMDFAGSYLSKDKVGGDLYDFFRVGKNSWGFLVADVSGHGVPSALIAMFLKAAFRTRTRWGAGSEQVCRDVNRDLAQVVGDLGLYATAFFGVADLETARFRYSNCGHPPVYLRRAASGEALRLDEKGMILGATVDDLEMGQSEVTLEPGDAVLATTDGVTESRNFLREMYGDGRLVSAFRRSASEPGARGEVDAILRDLNAFTLDAPANDDITVALLRFARTVLPLVPGHSRSDREEYRSRRRQWTVSQLRKQAREAWGKKDYALVESLLRAAFALEPGRPQETLLLALACLKQGKHAEMRDLAAQALAASEGDTKLASVAKVLLRKAVSKRRTRGAEAHAAHKPDNPEGSGDGGGPLSPAAPRMAE